MMMIKKKKKKYYDYKQGKMNEKRNSVGMM